MRGQTDPSIRRDGDLPRLLNVEEVAGVLGVNVRHVRRLVFERRIPYVKWGRLVPFDPREVDRWLRERTAAPAP